MIEFEWDSQKSQLNQEKHGVSFDEARSVFFDENAIQFFDDEYSEEEDRFILLGMSIRLRVLVVCHCERERGNAIRIISARKATRSERKYYSGEKQ
ncbi:BrnT family toxin [Synechococcus sp. PCC 7336]|uniref:BrnT family toxin n=1 Tax=Synechococcus sp. PCC 7336 TaxID=195250 RepID=UPI0003778CFE|nr:BrnT family toxin [Synechococcus sp. PCC 7336]